MKTLIPLSLLVLFVVACRHEGQMPMESSQIDSLLFEEAPFIDSAQAYVAESEQNNLAKVQELIKSTENSEKKVDEIKQIKKENVTLKKELKETQEELAHTKKALDSTIQENQEKEKKGFIKRVVDNITGKDTLQ